MSAFCLCQPAVSNRRALVHQAVAVHEDTPLNTLSDILQKAKAAVLVDDANSVNGIITMIDVIDFLAA
ncbi:MAG: CBS domain-containing protein [Chloroflexi bacterium]|nr:CBS domain-containing protein [Chloroflexota bacterium]